MRSEVEADKVPHARLCIATAASNQQKTPPVCRNSIHIYTPAQQQSSLEQAERVKEPDVQP